MSDEDEKKRHPSMSEVVRLLIDGLVEAHAYARQGKQHAIVASAAVGGIVRSMREFLDEHAPDRAEAMSRSEDVWPREAPHHGAYNPVEQAASYRRVMAAFRFKGARIPEHMHDTVVEYLVHHRPSYDAFFEAIVENDLHAAVGAADEKNIVSLHAWAAFFHDFAPSPAWGSGKRVQAWLQLGQVKDAAAAVGAAVEAGDPMVVGNELHLRVRPPAYPSHIEASIDFGAPIEADELVHAAGHDGRGLCGFKTPTVLIAKRDEEITCPSCRRGWVTVGAPIEKGEPEVHAAGPDGRGLCGFKTPGVLIAKSGEEITCPSCRHFVARDAPRPFVHILRNDGILCGKVAGEVTLPGKPELATCPECRQRWETL